MAPFINDCGKHIYAYIDGEWIDITDIKDACIRLAEEEDELSDDDIPFCDMSCCDCPEIVDEDGFEDYCDEEPLFWGIPDIRRIVFSDPATIVFWDDGTKTVVKTCEGDKFERYMGFAAACMKKMFGSTSRAKAVMEECDTENLKCWQEEALKPKAKRKEKKDEPKAVNYDDIITAYENARKAFQEWYNSITQKKDEGVSDGTPAE